MCVIIVKKAGTKRPTEKQLKEAYNANPHGCGFAVAKSDGTIYSYKSTNFDKFLAKFDKHVEKADPCIIHFRLATHGSICSANCHPFANEQKTLYFAHNGILPIESIDNKTDSQILFDSVLSGAAEVYGIESQTFKQIVSKTIGSSKFAFLDSHNVYMFGNFEQANGLYYSNLRGIYTAYKQRKQYSLYNWFDENDSDCEDLPESAFNYRSDKFFSDIFAEHNKAYKMPKAIPF